MTFADLIAACFWPLVVLFGLLLATAKDQALFRLFRRWALALAALYLGLGLLYPNSSIIAVVDWYLFIGVIGIGAIVHGGSRLRYEERRFGDLKEKLSSVGLVLFGLAMVGISGAILFSDFFQPRMVLEGRVEKVRTGGRRSADLLADIAGRTVKATAPVYERLKFKPYVRVEVGRGSNYIFQIEYLSN